ncbi:hypothetical protein [Nonomuraea diastatica]|uniref:hypothetical protein n=1 Tax=Nonomuraea diastatica TaxID=1848329 RepID=UPI00140E5DAC|nr:hypothetical protein [Nonomuraea diastatica]
MPPGNLIGGVDRRRTLWAVAALGVVALGVVALGVVAAIGISVALPKVMLPAQA